MDLFENATLHNMRATWRKTIEGDGGFCPCCDRWGKIYSISLDETAALTLLWMSKQADDWIDVPKTAPRWILRGKKHSLLAYWGFLEKGDKDEDDVRKSSGLWRLTPKGRSFVRGFTNAPLKAFIFSKTIEGFGTEMVHFRDLFGKRFNYQEVMADSFNINTIRDLP